MTKQALANIEQEYKERAQALQNQIQSTGNYISTKGKIFTAPDGTSGSTLNVVILSFTTIHEYYESQYVEGESNPPVCFAMGDNANAMVPHEMAIEQQSSECKTCPNFQWGSAPGGGKICKTQKLLALLTPDNPQADILLLKVSPTALKRFNTYLGQVAAQLGHPIRYITNISLYPSVVYPSLVFNTEKENTAWKEMWPRIREAETILSAVPQYVQEEKPVKALPQRVTKKVAKKTAVRRGNR
jgi:hypothetical protein